MSPAYFNHAIIEYPRPLSSPLMSTLSDLRTEDLRVARDNRTIRVPQCSDYPASGPMLRGSNTQSSTGGPLAKIFVKDTTKQKLLIYQIAAMVVCMHCISCDWYSKVLVTVRCPCGDRIPTPTLLQRFLKFHPPTGTIDTTVLADSDLYRSVVQH